MKLDAAQFRAHLVAGATLGLLMMPGVPAAAQTSATKTFTSEQYHYAVVLPAGCRHDEGPGTLAAICTADFDSERSAQASSTTALVMELSVEKVPGDAGASGADLAQRFTEAAFREELPQTVCGETDASRARIDKVKRTVENDRVVYTAEVICAEVRFLQIAERRARVKYLIAPEARYRLMARAPIEDFEKDKGTVEAYFESFHVLPNNRQNQ